MFCICILTPQKSSSSISRSATEPPSAADETGFGCDGCSVSAASASGRRLPGPNIRSIIGLMRTPLSIIWSTSVATRWRICSSAAFFAAELASICCRSSSGCPTSWAIAGAPVSVASLRAGLLGRPLLLSGARSTPKTPKAGALCMPWRIEPLGGSGGGGGTAGGCACGCDGCDDAWPGSCGGCAIVSEATARVMPSRGDFAGGRSARGERCGGTGDSGCGCGDGWS